LRKTGIAIIVITGLLAAAAATTPHAPPHPGHVTPVATPTRGVR
jgi:hypothetical protein